MLYYFARVELRGYPSGKDYENLHEAMRNKNFIRTIVGGDGLKRQLPDAEYVWAITIDRTTASLRDELVVAIEAVYTDFSLIVSKATEAAWHNLSIVS